MPTIAKKKRTTKPKAAKSSPDRGGDTWNGIGSGAVEKATGKSWAEWFKLLDKDKAAAMPHKEIALHVRAKYGVGDWWCQMVTVGYEQARGLRVKHQTASGYVANLSKTLPVSMAAAFKAVNDARQRAKWLDEAVTITKATPNKSVRMVWPDGSRVAVGIWDKTGKDGTPKAQVVFQHEKLKSVGEVKKSKDFWAKAAERLAGVIAH
jgi:hypothetical protein